MAPRGLSAEEKRVRLLEIFHESKDFYQVNVFPGIEARDADDLVHQLKELEKLGPRLKGIVSQSVKEVLQSLVEDGFVQSDKIGSSNFFWSFPSQRGSLSLNRLRAAKESKSKHESQVEDLEAFILREKAARPESENRSGVSEKLLAAKENIQVLEAELATYGACDPVKVEAKKRASTLAHEATIRWTDNYSILLAHFTRQNGVNAREICAFLGIDEDYEDIY